jgi:hypothetical protein
MNWDSAIIQPGDPLPIRECLIEKRLLRERLHRDDDDFHSGLRLKPCVCAVKCLSLRGFGVSYLLSNTSDRSRAVRAEKEASFHDARCGSDDLSSGAHASIRHLADVGGLRKPAWERPVYWREVSDKPRLAETRDHLRQYVLPWGAHDKREPAGLQDA